MKKLDALIYIVLLAVAAALFALWNTGGTQALTAHIYAGGELHEVVRLPDAVEIVVETPLGHNIIAVEAGGVRMILADCRTQDCIRMGVITRPGQLIACLPNRIVVRLEGRAGEEDFDAFTG